MRRHPKRPRRAGGGPVSRSASAARADPDPGGRTVTTSPAGQSADRRAGLPTLDWRRLAMRAAGAARLHWLAAALLAAGLAARVLALMAYHPALLYVDTLKYLYNAWPGADPL